MITNKAHLQIVSAYEAHLFFLKEEVVRLQQENRDLVNAVAINGRQTAPFARVKPAMTAVVPGRKSVFQMEKELERAEAVPASQ